MKNPELMNENGMPENLAIMFHKDNCSVITIQDVTEDSITGEELVENLNKLDCSVDSGSTAKLQNTPV